MTDLHEHLPYAIAGSLIFGLSLILLRKEKPPIAGITAFLCISLGCVKGIWMASYQDIGYFIFGMLMTVSMIRVLTVKPTSTPDLFFGITLLLFVAAGIVTLAITGFSVIAPDIDPDKAICWTGIAIGVFSVTWKVTINDFPDFAFYTAIVISLITSTIGFILQKQ